MKIAQHIDAAEKEAIEKGIDPDKAAETLEEAQAWGRLFYHTIDAIFRFIKIWTPKKTDDKLDMILANYAFLVAYKE